MYCGNMHQADRELPQVDQPCAHFVSGLEVRNPGVGEIQGAP